MDFLTVLASGTTAFVGVGLGHLLAARADNRTDRWRRREETMRMLRWAVELVASDNARGSTYGAAALEALLDSELLQPEDAGVVMRLVHQVRIEPDRYTDVDFTRSEGDEEHG